MRPMMERLHRLFPQWPEIIQVGFCVLHWGWFFIVISPADPIHHYPTYAPFVAQGDQTYWMHRSLFMATIATIGAMPTGKAFRALLATFQFFWVCFITYLYAQDDPINTGLFAYGVFAFFALALLTWRLIDADTRGR